METRSHMRVSDKVTKIEIQIVNTKVVMMEMKSFL